MNRKMSIEDEIIVLKLKKELKKLEAEKWELFIKCFKQQKIIISYEKLLVLRSKEYIQYLKGLPIEELYDLFIKDEKICNKIKRIKKGLEE